MLTWVRNSSTSTGLITNGASWHYNQLWISIINYGYQLWISIIIGFMRFWLSMESQKRIIQLWISIIQLWISIIEIWISIIQLLISIIQLWIFISQLWTSIIIGFMRFSIESQKRINPVSMDIHNSLWISTIQSWQLWISIIRLIMMINYGYP